MNLRLSRGASLVAPLCGAQMLSICFLCGLLVVTPALAGSNENEALWLGMYGLHVDAVNAALEDGADPNAPEAGNTIHGPQPPISALCAIALMPPRSTDDQEVVEFSNARPGRKITSKFFITDSDRAKASSIAELLFAHGAKIDKNDVEAILDCPIETGAIDIVSIFLSHGASPRKNYQSSTAYAKKYEQEKIYELLVARGGDRVDAQAARQLVLVEAAANADIDKVARALVLGAKLNSADALGETALCAAFGDDDEGWLDPIYANYLTAWWLLAHGADPNAPCSPDRYKYLTRPIDLLQSHPLSNPSPENKFLMDETISRLRRAGAK